MCTRGCLEFVRANLAPAEVESRSVLEVGSLDVNGTVRPIVASLRPDRYVGVDLAPGPGVDEVCDATGLVRRFGSDAFDVVISTEMLEHVRDWRAVASQLKRVLKPGGTLLLTTRSHGFPYHGFPEDFWRYETGDLSAIFRDFDIDKIETDSESPGVMFKGRKPVNFSESDLASHALYSIVLGARTVNISDADLAKFLRGRRRRFLFQAPERTIRKLRKKLWR